MSTANPWQRPPGEDGPPPGEPATRLAATETPIYRALLTTLHAASRQDEELPTLAAVAACVDLAYDIAVTSGLLWASPNLIESLRSLADQMEKRREAEAPRELKMTVREFFASARPIAH
jgi:hypothetical protein